MGSGGIRNRGLAAGGVSPNNGRRHAMPHDAPPKLRLVDDAGPPEGASAPWTPPRRASRHWWLKFAVGTVFTAAFAAWMIHRWSSGAIRVTAGVMAAATVLLTYRSLGDDLRRRRGKQVDLAAGVVYIANQQGRTVFRLEDVLFVQWRVDPEAAAGLWFFDREKKVLAHLDTEFVTDPAEARSLLDWLKRRGGVEVEARWPTPPEV
jgi:hypothetical protein